ncbi:MAG TPA: hypothetical protein VHR41_07520 [Gemmatimonadales bacterium]|jgi:hypothetical protein|nr:hypothetical protein [Gemmatimonadales bacterium]
MDTQQTCGKGLAEHSILPAKMGEWTAAMAENLELHLETLDLTDENSRREREAYHGLASNYRQMATQLRTTAGQMAGYRDLPMGRHDPKAMASPGIRAAFEGFVNLEQELLALLQKRVEQDRRMLAVMAGQVPAGTRRS